MPVMPGGGRALAQEAAATPDPIKAALAARGGRCAECVEKGDYVRALRDLIVAGGSKAEL